MEATVSWEQRRVKLFRNGRNQAVRIPVEFELAGTDAIIRREGDSLVIVPLGKSGLAALLDSWNPPAETLPDIEDHPTEPEDIF